MSARKIATDSDTARSVFLKQVDSESKRYFGDALQTFWCAALEADDAQAGHDAARKCLSDDKAQKFLIHGVDVIDPRTEYDPLADEPNEREDEPSLFDDSAFQVDMLADLLSCLPEDEQTIIADHMDGVSQADTARRLGCSQPNVSTRRLVIVERLRAVVTMRTNPITDEDLAGFDVTETQRAAIRALLCDEPYRSATVKRALAKLPEGAQKHVNAMLKYGKATRWARGR